MSFISLRCEKMEKGGMVGLVYGVILLSLGVAGLYNKANLCSYYVAGFIFALGILALIFGFYLGRDKK
jgi:hypothetical protein